MADRGPPAAFERPNTRGGRPLGGTAPFVKLADPYKVKPRSTGNMRPIAQAIQIALFRTDRGDNIPRIIKIGERLVREAVAGDNEALAFIRDMYEGKTRDSGEGEPVESLPSVAIVELLKHLIDQKRGDATLIEAKPVGATDVVAEMVERRRKE